MSTITTLFPPLSVPTPPPADALREALYDLDRLSDASEHVIAAPSTAFAVHDRMYHLPRYFFLGASQRVGPLRFLVTAGWEGDELKPSLAVHETLRRLVLQPRDAWGYQLLFYPVVNPTGYQDSTRRSRLGHDLRRESWGQSSAPEVRVVADNYVAHRADGVIVLTTTTQASDIAATISGLPLESAYVPLEPRRPPVHWQPAIRPAAAATLDPAQTPAPPIVLQLAVPDDWPSTLFATSTATLLLAFLRRYREARAHAQHL